MDNTILAGGFFIIEEKRQVNTVKIDWGNEDSIKNRETTVKVIEFRRCVCNLGGKSL